VSKLAAALALTIVATGGACKKTGEGEYQVKGPDVDKTGDTITIGTDTATVRTPSVDAGMKRDTLVVPRPSVDVKTPAERRGDTAAATKRP
jgi:hypothetical protein